MGQSVRSPLLGAGLCLLLAACGQSQTAPSATDPYANGADSPWSYTAPPNRPTTLALTPGENTLFYEPILSAKNGWGPVEVNRSNGEQAAGDGRPLTLNGKTYARGFGTHAGSELRFSLKGTGANCSRFTVDIGVDDEVGDRGSVIFQVVLDGEEVSYNPMTGSSPTERLDVNIAGAQELRLLVTDAFNGISYDHADWADPKIYCQDSAARLPGSLDTSFGQNGKVTTDFGYQATDWPISAAVDGQGRTLVLGNIFFPREKDIGDGLARYTRAGVLDSTFGQGGKVIFQGDLSATRQVLTDSQNRVLVLGPGSIVRRLTSAGVPDGSFGQAGRASTPDVVYSTSAALDAQSRIVVAGGVDGRPQLVLLRYTADGILDTSFGQGGRVFESLPYFLDDSNVVIDSAGRLVVAYNLAGQNNQPGTLFLRRYNSSGTIDMSFGQGGSVEVGRNTLGTRSLRVTASSHILIARTDYFGSPTVPPTLQRYTPSGVLDATFGQGGKVGGDALGTLLDIALDSRERLVIIGASGTLLRLQPNGQVDRSFGIDGRAYVDFTGGLNRLLIGPDNKYIGVGITADYYSIPPADFSLARYYGD